MAVERPRGFELWAKSNVWQRTIRLALRPWKLTHVQYLLLVTLADLEKRRDEPIRQADLAAEAKLDLMMTSQVIRSLEERGLLLRSPHPHDMRAFMIEPTPEGEKVLKGARPAFEAAETAFWSESS
ncbi:MAG: MarR family transcriptional regulator [Armatimonadetes bacterium]|nr:MarR family transcriptional regulator [Armatimonadota bacterium]